MRMQEDISSSVQDGHDGPAATADRSPMLEISNAMVRLYKEAFGRGPTKARAQFAGPDAIDQSTPLPPGSGSLMTTPLAVPVPAAPLFDAVTVKPICEPALTGALWSAVFVSDSDGQLTVTVAMALLPPVPLVVVIVAPVTTDT